MKRGKGSNSAPAPSPAPRAASIGDVAKRAGVSIATVSRVVNGIANKASAETVERVRTAIAAVGYRPTGAGQALRKGRSRLVAVLAANLANPAMTAIAASIETSLREVGLAMVLCDTHDRPDLQDEYLMEMRAQAVRAIVMLGAVESDQLSAALAGEAPVLFVNRRCPGGLSAPFVGIDNFAAGAAVADFLKTRRPNGRVAVIHGPLTSSATADRIMAFCRSFEDATGRLAARDIVTGPGLDHLEIGHSAMTSLLARGALPTSIFCSSDLIAFGAYRCLRAAGRAVPRDVLLVGFDDSPLNDWVAPWLSSVRVPYRDFGTTIVSALERIWRHETPTIDLLGFELIERR